MHFDSLILIFAESKTFIKYITKTEAAGPKLVVGIATEFCARVQVFNLLLITFECH